jgi:4-hydroxy-2-oxoheptanedioate aldolase
MIDLIKQIALACKAHGIAACLHCGTPEYAAQAIGWGYNMTTVGGDSRLLAGAAGASVAAWRKLNGRDGDAGGDRGMY